MLLLNIDSSFVAVDHGAASRFVCIFCPYILNDAVQAGCGHLFCKHCFDRVANCPSCGEARQEGFPDRAIRREVKNLPVKCGCSWEGTLGTLENHFGCCFAGSDVEWQCPHCGSKIKFKDKDSHIQVCLTIAHQEEIPTGNRSSYCVANVEYSSAVQEHIQSLINRMEDLSKDLLISYGNTGSMVWKIQPFSLYKETMSIFSPLFCYGYKMCLRLYILGDGIGKNTHMSLFFVVMKGEFDAILQWPFTHKVSFRLINQHHGRDVVDVFQPDPMSSSFQRPKTDMNVASGCPRFISLAELNQGGFIAEDTIFIKVKVDTSTIKLP